jgi:hypothetical protein
VKPFATLTRPANYRPAPKIIRKVFLTRHAIEQSIAKFPALAAVEQRVGRDRYVRMLTACAGNAQRDSRETYIVGDHFLATDFYDAFSDALVPVAFAARPDPDRPDYTLIITSLKPSEVPNNGNCRRETQRAS